MRALLVSLLVGCNLVAGFDRFIPCDGVCDAAVHDANDAAVVSDAPLEATPLVCATSADCASDEKGRFVCSNGACASVTRLVPGKSLHACAFLSDGAVWCWGRNVEGQLGRGTMTTAERPGPITIAQSPVTDVGMGFALTCARTANGQVSCVGLDYGTKPVVANVPDPAVELSVGPDNACVRTTKNEVHCWGNNAHGSIGCAGATSAPVSILTPTKLTTSARAISTGGYQTCALVAGEAARVRCWGNDVWGGLGDGKNINTDCRSSDFIVAPINVSSMTSQDFFMCANQDQGTRWCWGANFDSGFFWTPFGTQNEPTPRALPWTADKDGFGWRHNCYLQAGKVSCWGYSLHVRGENGALQALVQTPTTIANLQGVRDLVSYREASCVIDNVGHVACWGNNQSGLVAYPQDENAHLYPEQVVFP